MSTHNGSCQLCKHKLCAKGVPIFSLLDDEEIGKVVELIVRKEYNKGELIIVEGSDNESLVIINHGKAKVYRNTYDGKEQILYIFSVGDFFGERNLLRNQVANYHVEALEKTSICMIRKNDFQELLRMYPGIGFKIMEELSSRLERLENTVESMGVKNVEERIIAVLVEFAQKYGTPHSEGVLIELPISREGIANYIGLTRETVSRKMNLLQDEGIIEMIGNKKLLIKDLHTLKKDDL